MDFSQVLSLSQVSKYGCEKILNLIESIISLNQSSTACTPADDYVD